MSDISLEFNSDYFAAQLNDRIAKAARSATDTTSTWADKRLESLLIAANPDFNPRFIRKGRTLPKRTRPGRMYSSEFLGKKEAKLNVLKGRPEYDAVDQGVWIGRLFFAKAFIATLGRNPGVYVRTGRGRFAIKRVTVKFVNADEAMQTVMSEVGPEMQRRFDEKMAAN
jgi:hypothetical protein